MTLELRKVTKSVGGNVHIHETNLTLEEGTFNVLLGTTLSGKTTLMQLMAGLDKPSSGEIWFRGQNVTGVAVQKRNVSMVYQQFINYPHLTVYENIASPLRVIGVDNAKIKERVGKVAELLRLVPMLQRKPARAVGRPAAAHGDRARAGQGLRHHPARRAARESGLQAARGIARRAAAAVPRPALHRRLCHHRAGGGVAVRRQHRDPA